jgi:WD40 repeat protein
MGIYSQPDTGSFISISDAGTLKVCENHKGSVVQEISPNKAGAGLNALKAMVVLPSRSLVAVSDNGGNLYVYDTSSIELELVKTLTVETGSEIRGLSTNVHENYLVAGCTDGTISVFDLLTAGKEKQAKLLVSF